MTAVSRAFWNSGVSAGRAVSFSPLTAALVAIVAAAFVSAVVVVVSISTVLSSVVEARPVRIVLVLAPAFRTDVSDNLRCEVKAWVDASNNRNVERMAEVNFMVEIILWMTIIFNGNIANTTRED